MSEAYGKKEEELHQLLTIYKESWRDDHKFFSTKDLELAVDGLCGGKYEMVELEMGKDALLAVLQEEKAPDITMQLYIWQENGPRVMEKTDIPSQVKVCLTRMWEGGAPKELNGWNDITSTREA